MSIFTTLPKTRVSWVAPETTRVNTYFLNIGSGYKLNVGGGYRLKIQSERNTPWTPLTRRKLTF